MPWPFVHAPLRHNLFLSSLHTIFATFVFVWFRCTCWLMFIFCGVKDAWVFGLIFSIFHHFLDWALLGQKPSSSCQAHAFLFGVYGPFGYWSCHITSSCLLWLCLSFHFLLSHGLASWFSCRANPLFRQSFTQGFLGPFFTSLPLLGFVGQHSYLANIPTVPTHFTTSFLGLSQPVYFLLTSFTFIGFLLDYLDFPCSITISLPFITFWAYWTLSRPIEFTNSFLELPHPTYFFFTSFFFFFL